MGNQPSNHINHPAIDRSPPGGETRNPPLHQPADPSSSRTKTWEGSPSRAPAGSGPMVRGPTKNPLGQIFRPKQKTWHDALVKGKTFGIVRISIRTKLEFLFKTLRRCKDLNMVTLEIRRNLSGCATRLWQPPLASIAPSSTGVLNTAHLFRKFGIVIWVNYNISLTWIKAIWGWFPLLTMISSEVAVRSL